MASFSNSFSGAVGGFSVDSVVPVVTESVTAKGSGRRIHPRWIRDDEESELPEVIRKRTKLTKQVEKLLQKQEAISEVKLDLSQNKRELEIALSAATARIEADRLAKLSQEIDEEDDWLLLML